MALIGRELSRTCARERTRVMPDLEEREGNKWVIWCCKLFGHRLLSLVPEGEPELDHGFACTRCKLNNDSDEVLVSGIVAWRWRCFKDCAWSKGKPCRIGRAVRVARERVSWTMRWSVDGADIWQLGNVALFCVSDGHRVCNLRPHQPRLARDRGDLCRGEGLCESIHGRTNRRGLACS
jgi:hypothetical protein